MSDPTVSKNVTSISEKPASKTSKTSNTIIVSAPESSDINDMKQKGEEIIRNKTPIRDVVYLMSDPKVKMFFDNYFKTGVDTKTMLTFVKLYQKIERDFKQYSNMEPSKELIAYMMFELMTNSESRPTIIQHISEFLEDRDQVVSPRNIQFLTDANRSANNTVNNAAKARDFHHYLNHNMYWIPTSDIIQPSTGKKLFSLNQRVPCLFLEKKKDGSLHIIDVDHSIEDDGMHYTASRKVIGMKHGAWITVVLLNDQGCWTLEGKYVDFGSLQRDSNIVVDRKWIAPIDVDAPSNSNPISITHTD